MNTSENINELATALSKAQGKLQAASKDSVNPHFRSKYADLESVWQACRGPLSDHGLAIIQTFHKDDQHYLRTMLVHTSGQWITSDCYLKTDKNNMQGLGSAITYARRYGLMAIVGIAPAEDDDGNLASGGEQQVKSTKVSDEALKKQLYKKIKELINRIPLEDTDIHTYIEDKWGSLSDIENEDVSTLQKTYDEINNQFFT